MKAGERERKKKQKESISREGKYRQLQNSKEHLIPAEHMGL